MMKVMSKIWVWHTYPKVIECSKNVKNERISTNQRSLCNKTLASMHRNVILSMTDVVHLSRQNLLLVLFTYFCGTSNGFFDFLFFYSPILYLLGRWIASSLLLMLCYAERVWLPVISCGGKNLASESVFHFYRKAPKDGYIMWNTPVSRWCAEA